jgi:hypothetical protein
MYQHISRLLLSDGRESDILPTASRRNGAVTSVRATTTWAATEAAALFLP